MAIRLTSQDREAIGLAGTPAEISKGIAQYTQAQRRLDAQVETLTKKYPKQWVAMDSGTFICRRRSLPQLIQACEQQGMEPSRLAIRYLDPKPQTIIL